MARYVELDHGGGGGAARALVEELILGRLENEFLRPLDDSAVVPSGRGRMAITTDSYVVDPIFFPGGDIGRLAVNGTVNDLAMQGANPAFLTLALILEEGLSFHDLETVLDGVARAAGEAGVLVAAGDTKVVPRGHADKIFINTSGVGWIRGDVSVGAGNARPGDLIILSGGVGDHGIAVLAQREGLDFQVEVVSDTAPLNGLVASFLKPGVDVHVLRDPTRGGVATALNEIASCSGVGVRIKEKEIPVHPAVASACEMLGLDPLYVANEGKCLAVVPRASAGKVLAKMRAHPLGREAAVIGQVTESGSPARVTMETSVGGRRVLSTLSGELLPRIC